MKKNLIIILLLSIVAIPFQGHAQKKKTKPKKETSDQYSYTIVTDDPEALRNLNFIIDPVYVDINDVNLNLGWDAQIRYNFQNTFGVSVKYSKAYLEPNTRSQYVSPVGGVSPFTNLEIGASYNLSSETDSKEEKVTVKSVGNVDYYMLIPAKTMITKALRAGYIHINTYAEGNIAFSGYDISDPSKTVSGMNGYVNDGNFGTVMDESIIYFGYSKTTSTNLKVKYKNYGNKGFATSSGWYADIMFAPVINYADAQVRIPQGSASPDIFTTFHVNDNSPKFPLGARIGYTSSQLTTIGWNFGAEAGLRPAPDPLSGLYILINFGISLNVKV